MTSVNIEKIEDSKLESKIREYKLKLNRRNIYALVNQVGQEYIKNDNFSRNEPLNFPSRGAYESLHTFSFFLGISAALFDAYNEILYASRASPGSGEYSFLNAIAVRGGSIIASQKLNQIIRREISTPDIKKISKRLDLTSPIFLEGCIDIYHELLTIPGNTNGRTIEFITQQLYLGLKKFSETEINKNIELVKKLEKTPVEILGQIINIGDGTASSDKSLSSIVERVEWNDIIGNSNICSQVRKIVRKTGLYLPKEMINIESGNFNPVVCLTGPPGTGKTMITKAASYELSQIARIKKSRFVYQELGPQILDKFVGESSKKVEAAFKEVRDPNVFSVLVVDDADLWLKKRSDNNNSGSEDALRIIMEYLPSSSKDHKGNHIIFFTANNINIFDNALTSRFGKPYQVLGPHEVEHYIKIILNKCAGEIQNNYFKLNQDELLIIGNGLMKAKASGRDMYHIIAEIKSRINDSDINDDWFLINDCNQLLQIRRNSCNVVGFEDCKNIIIDYFNNLYKSREQAERFKLESRIQDIKEYKSACFYADEQFRNEGEGRPSFFSQTADFVMRSIFPQVSSKGFLGGNGNDFNH